MNARRLAAITRERAELLTRLAKLEEEYASALVEGENDTNHAPAHRTPRSRPVKQTQIVVPQLPDGLQVTELDRARAAAALRRVGCRTR